MLVALVSGGLLAASFEPLTWWWVTPFCVAGLAVSVAGLTPRRAWWPALVFAVADIAAVMRHLGIARAHVVGLSMGAFATLLFGLRHPEMATALVVAGVGTGSDLAGLDVFRADQAVRAARRAESSSIASGD